ncbi:MAG: FAD binding domain-containing protein [Gaiellaceae bacterium]
MNPAPLRYHRATSVDDALEALAEPDAKALAGGMSLLPVLKLRIARPTLVVDIGRLELTGIERSNGSLAIGALTTWDALARADELHGIGLDAIGECAAGIGDLPVRNRGTIGGSLAHADPASDMPAVALALGMELELRSPEGERLIAAHDFVLGPFTTALGEQELATAIRVPVPPPGSGSAYASVEHPASGFALAGAAALVRPDGGTSVAVTGVGARPTLIDVNDDAAIDGIEVFGDRFAGEAYRRHLVRVVVRRALDNARARAQGRAS